MRFDKEYYLIKRHENLLRSRGTNSLRVNSLPNAMPPLWRRLIPLPTGIYPVRRGSIRTEHKTIPRQVPGNRPVSHFVVTPLKYL